MRASSYAGIIRFRFQGRPKIRPSQPGGSELPSHWCQCTARGATGQNATIGYPALSSRLSQGIDEVRYSSDWIWEATRRDVVNSFASRS